MASKIDYILVLKLGDEFGIYEIMEDGSDVLVGSANNDRGFYVVSFGDEASFVYDEDWAEDFPTVESFIEGAVDAFYSAPAPVHVIFR